MNCAKNGKLRLNENSSLIIDKEVEDSSQKSDPDSSVGDFIRKNLWQLVFLVAIALIFTVPSLTSYAKKPSIPKVGDIAQEDIIAPVQFNVLKDPDSLKAEREAVARSVPLVVKYDSHIEDSVINHFSTIWSQTAKIVKSRKLNGEQKADSLEKIWRNIDRETRRKMSSIKGVDDFGRVVKAGLKIMYSTGFVSKDVIDKNEYKLLSIRRRGKEKIMPASSVMNDSIALSNLEQYFEKQFRKAPDKIELAITISKWFVAPNLIPDYELTERNRKRAVSSVSPAKMMVSKGEKIVGKHEKIDYITYLKLRSLYEKLHGSSRIAHPLRSIFTIMGVLISALIIVSLFGLFVFHWYPAVWREMSSFGTLAGSIIFVAIVAHILHIAGFTNYAVPINFIAALSAFLFAGWLSFASVIVSISLISVGFSGNVIFFISAMLSAAIISFGMQKVHLKNRLYLPIVCATFVGMVIILIFNYILYTPSRDILNYSAQFALSSLFSPFLAYLVLPLAEKISHIASEFTIVDLADINSILLQKLAVEAPGTFHHSIMVGNMAAAAAESIGADSELARVGGYYHDIGKLVHPEYFDENQTGINVHDRISPFESFKIISAHTKEGVELAKLHHLPQPVIDIIRQHHGTSVVEFFYRKAHAQNPDISPDRFRYDGPKPQTVEAAIVMICDTVEAAARSKDTDFSQIPDEELRQFIRKLVWEKLEDGQFDQANISMKQIKKVIEKIIPILRGAYHKRVPLDTKSIVRRIKG